MSIKEELYFDGGTQAGSFPDVTLTRASTTKSAIGTVIGSNVLRAGVMETSTDKPNWTLREDSGVTCKATAVGYDKYGYEIMFVYTANSGWLYLFSKNPVWGDTSEPNGNTFASKFTNAEHGVLNKDKWEFDLGSNKPLFDIWADGSDSPTNTHVHNFQADLAAYPGAGTTETGAYDIKALVCLPGCLLIKCTWHTGPCPDIISSTWAANVATIEVADSSVFSVGDPVYIRGSSLSGYNVSNVAIATIPDSTHVTIPLTTNPGGSATGGTISYLQDAGVGLFSLQHIANNGDRDDWKFGFVGRSPVANDLGDTRGREWDTTSYFPTSPRGEPLLEAMIPICDYKSKAANNLNSEFFLVRAHRSHASNAWSFGWKSSDADPLYLVYNRAGLGTGGHFHTGAWTPNGLVLSIGDSQGHNENVLFTCSDWSDAPRSGITRTDAWHGAGHTSTNASEANQWVCSCPGTDLNEVIVGSDERHEAMYSLRVPKDPINNPPQFVALFGSPRNTTVNQSGATRKINSLWLSNPHPEDATRIVARMYGLTHDNDEFSRILYSSDAKTFTSVARYPSHNDDQGLVTIWDDHIFSFKSGTGSNISPRGIFNMPVPSVVHQSQNILVSRGGINRLRLTAGGLDTLVANSGGSATLETTDVGPGYGPTYKCITSIADYIVMTFKPAQAATWSGTEKRISLVGYVKSLTNNTTTPITFALTDAGASDAFGRFSNAAPYEWRKFTITWDVQASPLAGAPFSPVIEIGSTTGSNTPEAETILFQIEGVYFDQPTPYPIAPINNAETTLQPDENLTIDLPGLTHNNWSVGISLLNPVDGEDNVGIHPEGLKSYHLCTFEQSPTEFVEVKMSADGTEKSLPALEFKLTSASGNVTQLERFTPDVHGRFTSKTNTSLIQSGAYVTVTTSAAHGLATGDYVTIAGTTPAAFSGTHEVEKINSTSYKYREDAVIANSTVHGTTIQEARRLAWNREDQLDLYLSYDGTDLNYGAIIGGRNEVDPLVEATFTGIDLEGSFVAKDITPIKVKIGSQTFATATQPNVSVVKVVAEMDGSSSSLLDMESLLWTNQNSLIRDSLTTSLLAGWKMDETAGPVLNDVLGNYPITLNTIRGGSFGIVPGNNNKTAVLFDGLTFYEAPAGISLSPSPGGQFTVVLWAKSLNADGGWGSSSAFLSTYSSGTGFYAIKDGANLTSSLSTYCGASTPAGTNYSNASGSILALDNSWHMFTFVFDATSGSITRTAYRDIDPFGMVTLAGATFDPSVQRITVGSGIGGGTATLLGRASANGIAVENMYVFSKAFTPADINYFYNNGRGVSFPFDDHYKFLDPVRMVEKPHSIGAKLHRKHKK